MAIDDGDQVPINPRRGFGTGAGRKKGQKSKHLQQREQEFEVACRRMKILLDDKYFDGDAHALMISVYRNTSFPIEIRLDAAKAAIPYEKPRLERREITMRRPAETDELTVDEMAAALLEYQERGIAIDLGDDEYSEAAD